MRKLQNHRLTTTYSPKFWRINSDLKSLVGEFVTGPKARRPTSGKLLTMKWILDKSWKYSVGVYDDINHSGLYKILLEFSVLMRTYYK